MTNVWIEGGAQPRKEEKGGRQKWSKAEGAATGGRNPPERSYERYMVGISVSPTSCI